MIGGVLVTPQRRIETPKGDVLHALKRSGPGFAGFGEAYFSMVDAGSIKGWKRHSRMTLNLVVPVGRVRFVILQSDAVAGEIKASETIELGLANYARLTVPPGLWLAFQGLEAVNLVLNVASEEHDPAEADGAPLDAFQWDWRA